jgi:restriction system protein
VELTKTTRDGGYDVLAIGANPMNLDLRIVIECKRYSADRPVGISVVRELWGVLSDPANRFDRGIVATSSRLSRDARQALTTRFWHLQEMDHAAIIFKQDRTGIWIPNL